MTASTVSTKGNEDRAISVEYDFGDDINHMIDLFGEEVVFSQAKAQMTVALQGAVRTALNGVDDKFKTDKQIVELAAAWKPGTKRIVKTNSEKLAGLWETMTPEQRKEFLADAAKS